MKAIDHGMMTSLGLMKYLVELEDKYEKLTRRNEQLVEARNLSNDKLAEIKDVVSHHKSDEDSWLKIKELLDIH